MARQGLMDDSGYDFLEPTDCSNFETCTEVAYQQGRVDERKAILGMVNYKVTEDVIRREFNIKIDAIKGLNDEQIIKVILEQLKEKKK